MSLAAPLEFLMSKENREMEDISGKFRKWLLEKDKWGLPRRRTDMCSDTLEIGFFYGYSLAQKEMQEKLDAAIEVIKFYGNTNNWDLDQLLERYDDGYDGEDGCCGQKARDFLKAMGGE